MNGIQKIQVGVNSVITSINKFLPQKLKVNTLVYQD